MEQFSAEQRVMELLDLLERGGSLGVFDYCFAEDKGTWSEGQARLYGVPRPEDGMPWQRWVQLLVPEDYKRFAEQFDRLVSERRGEFDFSFRIRHPEGMRWVGGFARVEYDAAGSPLRIIGINRDISDRKRAEQQALDAEQRKTNLMAAVAADLDNPLSAIRGALEVARKQAPLPDGLPWALASIEAQVELLARVANDLREAANGAGRSGHMEMKPFTIDGAIDMALQTAMPSLRKKNQQVAVCGSSDVLEVNGDAVRFAQSLSNLLACTAKSAPSEASLRLTSFAEGDQAILSIQADEMECTDASCGMALELARTVAAQHGGSVELREDGPERAREVLVRVPLARPPQPRFPFTRAAETALPVAGGAARL